MLDDEEDRPPEPGVPGAIRRVSRGLAAGVPFVGGLVAELVDGVLAPITERSLSDWLTDLAKRLRILEEAGLFTREDLKSPAFVEAAVAAARQAMVDSSEEKREALRNAVLNTALGRSPGADVRHKLRRCVEDLTPTHLQILRIIRDLGGQEPGSYNARQVAEPLSYFISRQVPDLAGQGDGPLSNSFCLDLINMGLVVDRGDRSGGFLSRPIALHALSALGTQLLAFIAAPPEVG